PTRGHPCLCFLFLDLRPPPRSPLFPYTTLFRSLITTCISRHGRNRAVGERLGKGEKLADIQAATPMVAEGVFTARSVFEESQQRSEEHTSELQSRGHLVCRLLLEKKKNKRR